MKMTTLKSVAIAAGVLGLALPAFGQATSDVVGYYTETLGQGFNAVGVSLHKPTLASGSFESDLTDTDGSDFSALLSDANATYLLEVISGDQAGAVAEVTAASSTELSVEGGLATGAAEYVIREAYTLNELFGDQLVGGTFVGPTLDVVWVPNGSGGFDQYAYNTGASEFRPTSSFFAPVSKPIAVFYPDGMFIQQASSEASEVIISGEVKETGTVLAANQGFNLVSSPAPTGSTLGNSGLSDFLTGGTFVGPSLDVVWIPSGGSYEQYAFNSGAAVWRATDSFFAGDASDTELTSAFFIQRNDGSDTAGFASVPSYYSSL